tara:strand:+ start:685 stop:1131 length:447 start_codon:yes stop_codon:yes gene_type:complete
MESENMNNMLASVLTGDREGFESAFKSEISDRIGTKIADRTLDVAKDLMKQPTSEDTIVDSPSDCATDNSSWKKYKKENESVTEAYKFKSSSDAKKFISAASNAGLNKRNFKLMSTTVDISGVRDKSMTQMLEMLAKEMKATTIGRRR